MGDSTAQNNSPKVSMETAPAAPPPEKPPAPDEKEKEPERVPSKQQVEPTESETSSSANKKSSKKSEVKNCCKGCCNYLYNKETNTVMGRGCIQWLMLVTFYILFYCAIAAFFMGLFAIVLVTSKIDKPRMLWTKNRDFQRSNIQQHPSLVIIPGADRQRNPDNSLLMFNKHTNAHIWGGKIKTYLKGYQDYIRQHPHCPSDDCFRFDLNDSTQFKQICAEENFGFKANRPTFIVRPTQVIGWKPEPFANKAEFVRIVKGKFDLPRIAAQWDDLMIDTTKANVMILCQGETEADDQLLGKVTYCTPSHMEAKFYPYKNKGVQLPPFVMIQYEKPVHGMILTIECFVVTKNMQIDRKKFLGVDRFEIYINGKE